MILEEVRIKRSVSWRDNEVSYGGSITMSNESANLTIKVNDTLCRKIIELCANAVVDAAQETAAFMKADIITQINILENREAEK